MLASITPLGQRGRHSSYGEILVALIVGAAIGGGATGLILGAVGGLVIGGLDVSYRIALAGLGLAFAGAADLQILGLRVPSGRRQVNENWLSLYRGWVTGVGFGVQLGVGVATVVSTAGVWAVFSCAFLSGSSLVGGCIGLGFGFVRGAISLASSRVRTTNDLVSLTKSINRWRGLVARATGLAMLLSGALLALSIPVFS